jgi:hypothetical protein
MLTYADVCGGGAAVVLARPLDSLQNAAGGRRRRTRAWYSIYLLYWYKSTNSDAEGAL